MALSTTCTVADRATSPLVCGLARRQDCSSPCTTTCSELLFDCGPQGHPARSCTLRSTLHRLLRARVPPVPGGTVITSTFSHRWRSAGRLDWPSHPALLLVLSSCLTAVHKDTQARSCTLRSTLHRLLRARVPPVPGGTVITSTFSRRWRSAGRLDWPSHPALLLVLSSCLTAVHKDTQPAPALSGLRSIGYFVHEYHPFQEALSSLLHSLADGGLRADSTGLLTLHYYWF
ncbi:uncharacterized protein LOC119431309 [Dermacentor silvarum]|uniref:uncharacterized protein LOC119431309 n=1 Tax=Dermacentor silvarum TaxID=543639 RepID=UPI00210109B8|nr:uncharacterized protein LOC119431309 [Dermacentor silvarum]